MCITLVANIIWRFGHATRSSLLLVDFSFHHHNCRQFSKSQLCNMIVLGARLIETLLSRQIVLSMHKKMVEENWLGAKGDYF